MKMSIVVLMLVSLIAGCSKNQGTPPEIFANVFPETAMSEQTETEAEVNAPPANDAQQDKDYSTEFVPGSGRSVIANGSILPAFTQAQNGITLNFVNTDIKTVVSTVAGSMLNLPFQIDPQVSGSLTLQTSAPVSQDAILPILEDALRLQDVAIVERGGFWNFVPISKAPKAVQGLRVGRPSSIGLPGFAIQVVPLEYSTASEMQKVLQPFAPQGGILRVDDERSLLVIAGTSQELALMNQTIQMFDVNWFKGKSFALYKPRNVEAQVLADELAEIFSQTSGENANAIRLVPIPRINTILGIAADIRLLQEVDGWVKRLDVPKDGQERKIYVYRVKNGRVEDLAYSIGAIFSDRFASAGPINQTLPGPAGGGQPLPATAAASQPIAIEGLKIVPDVINNSLLIYATPLEFRLLHDAVEQLDVPAIQVLIETTLAEVRLNDELRYGVQWFFESGDSSFTLSEAASGAAAASFPGFSYVFDNSNGKRVVLNALSSVTDVNIISSPKVMVLNNQSATIQVGDQVPVTTQSAVSVSDPDAPIVNSVEFRDTGVIMTVTPHVNDRKIITLDISQEVSDVVETTTSGIDSPTIQQRRITSTVVLESGQTVALGGLIRQTVSISKSGIPFLRNIPVIGNAFGSKDNVERRSELIILISARAISNLSESQDVLDDLKRQFPLISGIQENESGE